MPRLLTYDQHYDMTISKSFEIRHAENCDKSLVLRKFLGEVAFKNITRLVLGKRFVNSNGVIDDQGLKSMEIVANSLKFGVSLSMAEHIPWLRWMFPLDEEAFTRHVAQEDRFNRAIIEKHTAACHEIGSGAEHHFVDALVTSKEEYGLSKVTIFGLLGVCMCIYYNLECCKSTTSTKKYRNEIF
ncbi:hypothetical protein Vadar_028977 [Vaccinium darrowii]|uniref:Uncharacterized protein n=1 Tax=Vaccinium darrowii TaxID=229202 RepID=A0ACB7XUR3_9ERIC|nr:hypothetical protein Vadar_028977 [Vaccinium darrowii]